MNCWLSLDQCRELAAYMSVPELEKNSSRIMTWNKLKEYLPTLGYNVEQKRKRLNKEKGAVQAYYITGEWCDVEIEDINFLTLVAAKSEKEKT